MKACKATYRYLPCLRPALLSGTHTLRIHQRLAKAENNIELESFERSQQIVVRTPRFCIDPELIHACYPPDGHAGDYQDQLPYVVLSQATLPWQLSASVAAQHESPPWLALLLFDDLEPAPETTVTTAIELKQCPPLVQPARRIAVGEAPDDAVTLITLTRQQFERLAPTVEDLAWLTHVRNVQVEAKAASDEDTPGQDYAVIMGNRCCQVGRRYTAHLVALDEMAPYLPEYSNPNSEYQAVRLISLLSWNFSCNTDQGGTFTGLLATLDHGPMALPVRVPDKRDSAPTRLVKRAYARGYCALDHQFRNGTRTVSWYRGPLSPLKGEERTVDVASRNSDSLLRYDPQLGMFDVGYAAAWQLGRQLALANKAFGNALYRYRAAKLHNADSLEQPEELQRLAHVTELSPADLAAPEQLSAAGIIANEVAGVSFDIVALSQWLLEPTPAQVSEDYRSETSLLEEFLGRLCLLHGVPLGYLVPEPAMLPAESLRFFQLDQDWLTALLDGSLSLGCDDPSLEADERQTLIGTALSNASNVRTKLLTPDQELPEAPQPVSIISGFLLRSQVVTAWPGLEAQGFSDEQTSLPLLRMEQLAPGILLCLFSGSLHSARLIEPAESQSLQLPKNAQRRGEVWAAARDAAQRGWSDAARLAAGLASGSRIVTFEMRDQQP